jgi:hypothetical protein
MKNGGSFAAAILIIIRKYKQKSFFNKGDSGK